MEGGENHEPPRFCIEVNVPRGGRKLVVLRLHHGTTLQCAVEATVDLCQIGCFSKLFGDGVIIFSIVLSKKDNFSNLLQFKKKFTEEDGPLLPPLRSQQLCFSKYPILT